jgi:alkylation response protein AidB-like acyl-CoA dehydrogenase
LVSGNSPISARYFATEDYELIRKQVQDFAKEEVKPRTPNMESSRAVDYELARLIARQRWTSASYGQEYGGIGIGHGGKVAVLEELSVVNAAAGAAAQAGMIPTEVLLHLGDDEQKARWLPAIASGYCLPAIAVTEPETGGDLLAMQSHAELVGDTYVLNGRKASVGNAHVADMHIVIARTADGSSGLSAFIVEADRPGFEVAPHVPMLGLNGFSCGEVIMTNCRVPVANRIGLEGQGLIAAHTGSVLCGRPNLAAVALGLIRAAWEAAAQAGKDERLKHHQTVQQRVGMIRSKLIASRELLYGAVGRLDSGLPCDEELLGAKLEIVEAAEEATRAALRVCGSRGLYTNRPVERYFRDAPCLWFPAGTGDFQRFRLYQLPDGRRPQVSEMFVSPLALS